MNRHEGSIFSERSLERVAGNASPRSPEDVFQEHLALRAIGEVEQDINRNYAEDVVICSAYGTFHGHDGVRECSKMLKNALGDATFSYKTTIVCDDIAFLEWTARSETAVIEDGADTFLIQGGRIVKKTVHYTPRKIGAEQSK